MQIIYLSCILENVEDHGCVRSFDSGIMTNFNFDSDSRVFQSLNSEQPCQRLTSALLCASSSVVVSRSGSGGQIALSAVLMIVLRDVVVVAVVPLLSATLFSFFLSTRFVRLAPFVVTRPHFL